MNERGGFPSGSIPSYSPDGPIDAPPVVLWYKLYVGLLAAIYFLLLFAGIFISIAGIASGDDDAIPAVMIGIIYVGMGFVLGIAHLIPLVLRPRPWLWVYAIVLIAISMTSLCCIPLAIPLLIFWIKEENRMYYRMGS